MTLQKKDGKVLFLTWIKQQVTSKHVFHNHVGAKLDALQATVMAIEVDRKCELQVHHQTSPTH